MRIMKKATKKRDETKQAQLYIMILSREREKRENTHISDMGLVVETKKVLLLLRLIAH